jgi:phosphoribosyl-AMP cyclohydrolase
MFGIRLVGDSACTPEPRRAFAAAVCAGPSSPVGGENHLQRENGSLPFAKRGFSAMAVVILQQNTANSGFNPLWRPIISNPSPETAAREQGRSFMPKFDSAGLLTAVVTDAASGEVLMVAFMNQQAIDLTLASGLAHFYSRSRGRLWQKGETSGHTLAVQEILVDCDQDALVIRAIPAGPACHTNARSCFYRRLGNGGLVQVED